MASHMSSEIYPERVHVMAADEHPTASIGEAITLFIHW